MIPYEPWNQNIVSTDVSSAMVNMTPGKVYFIQFLAPSTGYYTEATMLLGFNDLGNLSGTDVGFAIYDNSVAYNEGISQIDGTNVHGVPSNLRGQGIFSVVALGLHPHNSYINVSFDTPINLVIDQPYWFAFAFDGTPTAPIYAIHEDYDPSMNSIFETVSNSDFLQGGGGFLVSTYTYPAGIDASMNASEHACWFRLSDPSSNFLVGPQGPTGPQGMDGANSRRYIYIDDDNPPHVQGSAHLEHNTQAPGSFNLQHLTLLE